MVSQLNPAHAFTPYFFNSKIHFNIAQRETAKVRDIVIYTTHYFLWQGLVGFRHQPPKLLVDYALSAVRDLLTKVLTVATHHPGK
jgi:hypothetical protein